MRGNAQVAGVAERVEALACGEQGIELLLVLAEFSLWLLLLLLLLLLLRLLLDLELRLLRGVEWGGGLLLLGLEGGKRLLLGQASQSGR